MKFILSIIIFILIINPVKSEYGWFEQNSNTNLFLYTIHFNDSLNGWIAGDKGLILHTSDGGKNWETQDPNVGSWLLSIFFIDNNNGWTCGDFGRIKKTTDGGKSWIHIESPAYPIVLNSIFFINENLGWAVGPSGIIHTTDGGYNWKFQYGDSLIASKSIYFINKDFGWICGANGSILRTLDGGKNWETQQSPTNGILYDIYFIDIQKGWAVSRHEPKIIKTTNGGNDWFVATENTDGFFKRIQFIDDNIGWAVGPGGIIKSTDGGESWKRQIPISRYNLWWASFTDSLNGWAVGGDGKIIHTNNGGKKFFVNFDANKKVGYSPLSTTFTDLTTGNHNSWNWDFGDGGTHNTENPVYIYQKPGTYSVKLKVSDGLDNDSLIKYDYIKVLNPNELIADFVADTTFGTLPLTTQFTDLSQGEPDTWLWNFGDGGTHTTQNPIHIYQTSGTFTVSLSVKNDNEESKAIKENYIVVNEPISVTDKSNLSKQIIISPNPTYSHININILLKSPTKLEISLIEPTGKIINILHSEMTHSVFNKNFNLSDLSKYFFSQNAYILKFEFNSNGQKEVLYKNIILLK